MLSGWMPPSVKLLIVADHASNYIPKKYDNLGLSKKDIFTNNRLFLEITFAIPWTT